MTTHKMGCRPPTECWDSALASSAVAWPRTACGDGDYHTTGKRCRPVGPYGRAAGTGVVPAARLGFNRLQPGIEVPPVLGDAARKRPQAQAALLLLRLEVSTDSHGLRLLLGLRVRGRNSLRRSGWRGRLRRTVGRNHWCVIP